MSPYAFLLSLVFAASIPGVARAQEAASYSAHSEVKAYAIIVGNNAGGAGQEDLQYAEADAKRMSSVLRELGGYQFQETQLLLTPSPLELWDAFETVQGQLAADHERGMDSVLFFYYSGHARASALDLGASQVAPW